MKLTDSLKQLFIDTAADLTGAARRLFMAKVVKQLGSGGQSQAEQELGWNRGTLRKGLEAVGVRNLFRLLFESQRVTDDTDDADEKPGTDSN